MQDLKIKVCGMTQMDQLHQLAELGVDYAGFIFYDKSPRYVHERLDAVELKRFRKMKKVGVFVNEKPDEILKMADTYGLDAVQLHGDEAPEDYRKLSGQLTLIKAIRVEPGALEPTQLSAHDQVADYLLFDTGTKAYGGSGLKFEWNQLAGLPLQQPYFLSGGLGPEDPERILQFAKTQALYAIDVNSRFETAPGVKDLGLIKDFLQRLRNQA